MSSMQPDPPTAPEQGSQAGGLPVRDPSAAPPAQGPAWIRRALPHGIVLVPLLFLLVTGLRGIDFGKHWDEGIQVENLHTAIETQTLLPKWYRYPSMLFWMTLGSLAPEILEQLPRDGAAMKAAQERLNKVADSSDFRLRMRRLFLIVTCLAVLWTYVISYAWHRSLIEAFLAASCLGLSWEIAYHARWVAPDALLMQFGALTLMFLMLSLTRRDGRWLFAAALAAGLGCGTKYTGGILLLPVLLAALAPAQSATREPWTGRARHGATLIGLFLLAFVLSTPGALLQPFVFFRHVGFEIEHYRTGHYGATIDAGIPHLLAMGRYLAAHLFSQEAALAILVTVSAILGLVHAFRRSPRTAILLACFPVAYVLYMSTQRVMFVRNLLLVAPVIALFAAHGATRGLRRLKRGRSDAAAGSSASGLRLVALPCALAALLWLINGPFLLRASQTIRERDGDSDVRAFSLWAGEHPDLSLFVSRRVARKMKELQLALPAHATKDPASAVEAAAFFPSELPSNAQLLANRPGTALAIFGPLDVNFAFYPAWPEPKIIVYPAEDARAAGLLGRD